MFEIQCIFCESAQRRRKVINSGGGGAIGSNGGGGLDQKSGGGGHGGANWIKSREGGGANWPKVVFLFLVQGETLWPHPFLRPWSETENLVFATSLSASVYSNHGQVKINVYRNDLLSIIHKAPAGEEPSTRTQNQIIPPFRHVPSASMVV